MPSSHQNQARSPSFHSIRSSAFHRISHRPHAFHRVSHQPGWPASCNTGLKVISAHRNSSTNRASPAQYNQALNLSIFLLVTVGLTILYWHLNFRSSLFNRLEIIRIIVRLMNLCEWSRLPRYYCGLTTAKSTLSLLTLTCLSSYEQRKRFVSIKVTGTRICRENSV